MSLKNFRNIGFGLLLIAAMLTTACQPEHKVSLEKLPEGVQFTGSLDGKFSYDAQTKQLLGKGKFTPEDKDALLKLSSDPAYQEAALLLYEWNQEGEAGTKGYLTIVTEPKMASLIDSVGNEFMKTYKNTTVVTKVAADDNEAVELFVAGKARLIFISRNLKPEELERCKQKGYEVNSDLVVRDAVCFLTNPANTVKALDVAKLKEVLAGKVGNWSDVGGANAPVQLLVMDPGKGLSKVTEDSLMKGEPINPQAIPCADFAQMREALKTNPGALGIASRRFAARALADKPEYRDTTAFKVLALKGDMTDGQSVAPFMYFVYKGLYPVVSNTFCAYERNQAIAVGLAAFAMHEGHPVFSRHGLMPMQVQVTVNQ
ncbi:MAG: hypothetical protein HGB19_02355 [Chlorobiales bacterium]|jgi:ABC-type phosphate transport system substrate-binding protein|nr:hypothetical protein [Chlorobiales bacterium]